MSKNIKVFLIDNKNEYLEEIGIEKPQTLDEFLLTLKHKMNNFPDYYSLFYISDDKEINIQNNDQYHLFSNNILYIRKENPKENAGTLFKISINTSLLENKNEKDKMVENDEINELKKEIKEKEKIIEENNKYIEKTFLFFKRICKKLKTIHLLINPEINNLLENLIKEISYEKLLNSFNEISDIILEEMDDFQEFLNNKFNINSINEKKNTKKKKEKTKTHKKFETQIKKKTIVEIKDKNSISKTEIHKNKNLPYSCILRISKKDFPDITYDNLGPK